MCPAFLQFFYCKSSYKYGFTVLCVPCMLEHVCYEPFSLKTCKFGRYLNWLNFVYCLKFTSLNPI